MFTGIVEATAAVLNKSDDQLTIGRPSIFDDIDIGCSIAVSGVCLSVVSFDDRSMTFDVIHETWSKTNLGQLHEGDHVNLERALKADGRFEGHIVQGHVEEAGTVASFDTSDSWTELHVSFSDALKSYIVTKGSVALDGVSLTVADVADNTLKVALIPHTLEHTTLGGLKSGDKVNIESDILGRYVYTQRHES